MSFEGLKLIESRVETDLTIVDEVFALMIESKDLDL